MLDARLRVSPVETGLQLRLTVENTGEDPIELRFSSGQRVEFTAERDGEEVWRWSEGRMFTQALSTQRVVSDETVSFDAEWSDPPSGEFLVRGRLTARNHDAAAEMTVSL